MRLEQRFEHIKPTVGLIVYTLSIDHTYRYNRKHNLYKSVIKQTSIAHLLSLAIVSHKHKTQQISCHFVSGLSGQESVVLQSAFRGQSGTSAHS